MRKDCRIVQYDDWQLSCARAKIDKNGDCRAEKRFPELAPHYPIEKIHDRSKS